MNSSNLSETYLERIRDDILNEVIKNLSIDLNKITGFYEGGETSGAIQASIKYNGKTISKSKVIEL